MQILLPVNGYKTVELFQINLFLDDIVYYDVLHYSVHVS